MAQFEVGQWVRCVQPKNGELYNGETLLIRGVTKGGFLILARHHNDVETVSNRWAWSPGRFRPCDGPTPTHDHEYYEAITSG